MRHDHCSFCGKTPNEGRDKTRPMILVAGPTVFVCEECIELCVEVVRERRNPVRVMAYTVGNKSSYDTALKAQEYARAMQENLAPHDRQAFPDSFRKLGKTDTYEGGCIWKTEQEARSWLEKSGGIRSDDGNVYEGDVYGVVLPNGWTEDTADGNLLVDAELVLLPTLRPVESKTTRGSSCSVDSSAGSGSGKPSSPPSSTEPQGPSDSRKSPRPDSP